MHRRPNPKKCQVGEKTCTEDPTQEKCQVGEKTCTEDPTQEKCQVGEKTCTEDPTQEKCQVAEKTCEEDPTQEKCKEKIEFKTKAEIDKVMENSKLVTKTTIKGGNTDIVTVTTIAQNAKSMYMKTEDIEMLIDKTTATIYNIEDNKLVFLMQSEEMINTMFNTDQYVDYTEYDVTTFISKGTGKVLNRNCHIYEYFEVDPTTQAKLESVVYIDDATGLCLKAEAETLEEGQKATVVMEVTELVIGSVDLSKYENLPHEKEDEPVGTGWLTKEEFTKYGLTEVALASGITVNRTTLLEMVTFTITGGTAESIEKLAKDLFTAGANLAEDENGECYVKGAFEDLFMNIGGYLTFTAYSVKDGKYYNVMVTSGMGNSNIIIMPVE